MKCEREYKDMIEHLKNNFEIHKNTNHMQTSARMPSTRGNIKTTTISDLSNSIALSIMTHYLVPKEAIRLLWTCRHFNCLNSAGLWQSLCKWQSPLSWDRDPFHHQIRQIQEQLQRKLAYHQLYNLRIYKSPEPWKLKTVIDLKSILRLSSNRSIIYGCLLYNGNIFVGLENSIEILSRTGAKVTTIPHPKYYASWPMLGGGLITCARDDTQAYIWSFTGELIAILKHSAVVTSVRVFLDGDILTLSDDAKIHRWSPDGKLVITYDVQNKSYEMLGKGTLVITPLNGPILLLSREGNQIATLDSPHYTGIDIFRDGRIVTISWDKQAKIWSPDGTLLSTFTHPSTSTGSSMYVRVLPNDNIVTLREYENYICLWSPTGELMATLAHPDWIRSPILTLSNGFVTQCFDSKMRIWSLTGHLIANLGERRFKVNSILGKADGEIVTYDWNKQMIHMWSVDVESLMRARNIWDQMPCVVT